MPAMSGPSLPSRSENGPKISCRIPTPNVVKVVCQACCSRGGGEVIELECGITVYHPGPRRSAACS